QGLFVKGFGQAFAVSGDELVDFVHLVEGHKRIDNGAELTSPADAPV
ncbi:MAG: heme utilization protein HutZ, partial [Aeromonas veronii]